MKKEDVGRFCKDCKESYSGCHDECFFYNVEKARWKIFKAKMLAEQETKKTHFEYMNEKMIRRHK